MRISPLDLEWAVAGAKPKVVERFFIQRTLLDEHADGPVWVDARIDVNMDGCTTRDQALTTIERLRKGEHFSDRIELRVIRRTFTIETEVVEVNTG